MKNLFIAALMLLGVVACAKREEVKPIKPAYLDTCRCKFNDVMNNRLPADSCGTIKKLILSRFGEVSFPMEI